MLIICCLLYLQGSWTVLGVTGCVPDSLTSLPDDVLHLPQSRLAYGLTLYTDGKKTGRCPVLHVPSGQLYGVSWTPDHVTFYRRGSVYYVWEVDTPDTPQVWGVVQMCGECKLSVVDTGGSLLYI